MSMYKKMVSLLGCLFILWAFTQSVGAEMKENTIKLPRTINHWIKSDSPRIITAENIFDYMNDFNGGIYYILTGKSKNGTNHCVICKNGGIVWDPAIDDSGIVGPTTDGHYSIEFLVDDIEERTK